ncbi:uncharacterized protein TNIN_188241 [Trichonephila inaurata madagascariensis]|uniref:Uncharacterized protein n=1 Tax=Trichonephila inaurata madagascariensis TaxID=2747483 RepID=A0A8X7BU35_9ARAC|nr:uncharacterized protein TNIN_188241 [Trichonephila inaurata madagascariensis]
MLHPLQMVPESQKEAHRTKKIDTTNPTLQLNRVNIMIEIYKSSQKYYYIYAPKITFPTFVDNHILPCPVGTRLKFHAYASDRFANVEFQRTEARLIYIQNIRFRLFVSPYFNQDRTVTPDALHALILRGFKSFPSLIMKYNTTTVSIWARCQIFWNPPGIVPEDCKLDAYLQLKPLRHVRSRGKRIVTSLNELWGDAKSEIQPSGWRRICIF